MFIIWGRDFIQLTDIFNWLKEKYLQQGGISEATTGFEPVIRVLQTLAFPLGHVANITWL